MQENPIVKLFAALTRTNRRALVVALTGAVLAALGLSVAFTLMPTRAAPIAAAATTVGSTFARVEGVTGGTGGGGTNSSTLCTSKSIADTDVNNEIGVDTFQFGMTQTVRVPEGPSGPLTAGAVVFGVGGAQWFTPQMEKVMPSATAFDAVFCMFSGSLDRTPTKLETYEFQGCFAAGVNTTLQAGGAEDLFTFKCGRLIHTMGNHVFKWDFITNRPF